MYFFVYQGFFRIIIQKNLQYRLSFISSLCLLNDNTKEIETRPLYYYYVLENVLSIPKNLK